MSNDKSKQSDETLAKLAARLEALEAENAKLKGAQVPTVAVLKSPLEVEREQLAATSGKKRDALKAATKKEGKLAFYRIPTPHYRDGKYYEAGSVVAIPVDEEPSVTWSPVVDEGKPVPAPAAPAAPAGRASDQGI